MATGYTTNIRMITPTQGTLNGTWGDTINNSITSLADAAIAGTTTVSMTTADYTLSVIDGAADESRSMFLYLTGAPGAARNVICPALSKLYFVANATAYDQTLKTPSGTGITVPTGKRMILFCNGTNVLEAMTYASMGGIGLGDNNTWTGAQTFTNSMMKLLGSAGGSTTFASAGTSGTYTQTFPAVTGAVVVDGATQTLTNKWIKSRVGTTTSSATPTINTDLYDIYELTAQAVNITGFDVSAGTPVEGDGLIIVITGTATRTITWGASFEASSAALPTTTVGTARLTVGFMWNSTSGKWRCMGSV